MIRYLMAPLALLTFVSIAQATPREDAVTTIQAQGAPVMAEDARPRRHWRRHRTPRTHQPTPAAAPMDIPAPAPIMEPEPSPKFDLALERVTVSAVKVQEFIPRFVDQWAWIEQELPQWQRPEMAHIAARVPPVDWWEFLTVFVIVFCTSASAAMILLINLDRLKSAWRDLAAAYAEWKLNRRDVMEMTT